MTKKKNKIKLTDEKSQIILEKCTRIEVIDKNGRSYVNWSENNKITISMQDDFQTLKIFVQNK
jgi:hypothetical protein